MSRLSWEHQRFTLWQRVYIWWSMRQIRRELDQLQGRPKKWR